MASLRFLEAFERPNDRHLKFKTLQAEEPVEWE